MEIDKVFNNGIDGVADNLFSAVNNSVSEIKAMQQRKAAENVQLVIQALKKIDSDIRSRYDEVGNAIEKRVATIKDGRDGINGKDGKNGKDGRDGKQGVQGTKGQDGINGRDGVDGIDGISVTSARIDFDGSLVISLSSGIELNVGEVVAPDLAESIKVITNGGGTSQSVLDTLASLQTQITNLIPSQTGNSGKYLTTNGTTTSWGSVTGSLSYQGTWNASTNTPTLTSSVGTNGYYYIVATAGSTNLNGITDWQIGDWLLFNGATWQKIDQTNLVTSVAGRTGAVTLSNTDISGLGTMSTQNASSVAVTGGTINGTTIGATTPAAGTFTSISDSGNLTFTGTGNRITGDFSNGTQANRVAFQTSTANSNSALTVIPSGTGAQSSLNLINNSDPTNSSTTGILTSATESRFQSTIFGTGTYLPMTFYTGGSERVRIDTSGNVGIGVTPSAWSGYRALQIGSTTSLWSGLTAGTNASSFYTNNGYFNGTNRIYLTTGYATEYIQGSGQHIWYNAPSGTAGNAITFTQAMTLDASGNLLVGTTSNSPASRLLVAGGTLAVGTSGTSPEFQVAYDGTNAYLDARLTGGGLIFRTNGSSERMRIDSSGNVSIASANAGARSLYVYNSDAGAGSYAQAYVQSNNGLFNITVGSTANGGIASLYSTSTGGAYLYTVGAYSLRFGTNSSEAMRIDSSGNVGIGTNSPASNSVTIASKTVAMTTGYGMSWNSGATQFVGYDTNILQFITASTERMRIDSSGNVGIGTSSPTSALDVSGKITAVKGSSGGITIGDVSTNSNSVLRMQGTSAGKNWQIANNLNVAGLEFTPSTTNGGTTFTTPAVAIDSSGNLLVGTTSNITSAKINIAAGSSDGVMYQIAQFTGGSGTGGNEVGEMKRQTTASVANSATTIESSLTFGELVTVTGVGAGAIFADLLMASYNTVSVISSNTQQGSPASRTYSISSGALKLTMGSATAMYITIQSLISGAKGA